MPPVPLVVLSTLLALSRADLGTGPGVGPSAGTVYRAYTTHPTGLSSSSSSTGLYASYPTGPAELPAPPALPALEQYATAADLQLQQPADGSDNPYGDIPPPPPPPPGPPPPYTVNPARGVTYATAPEAPPLRASYAASPRISYGSQGVLARVGYTAPPIAVAAPALFFTGAKDGGLAQPPSLDPVSAYFPGYQPSPAGPPQGYQPPAAQTPPQAYQSQFLQPSPAGPPQAYQPPAAQTPPQAYQSQFLQPSPAGPPQAYQLPAPQTPPQAYQSQLFQPSYQPALQPSYQAGDPLFGVKDPVNPPPPPPNPNDNAPQRFVQNFRAPPVSPILLSRNRIGGGFFQGYQGYQDYQQGYALQAPQAPQAPPAPLRLSTKDLSSLYSQSTNYLR